MDLRYSNAKFPGGALGQIFVGDVPSKFQKHTCSLYQFFGKSIPDLIPIFRKSISFLIFHTKTLKIGTVLYTEIVKIDTVLYTNIWKIDTLPNGTSRTQNVCSAPPGAKLPYLLICGYSCYLKFLLSKNENGLVCKFVSL